MILTPHILVGAAIVSKMPNIWGLILAFLSHFVLDSIPHCEYSLKGIKRSKGGQFFRDIIKAELDFCLGIVIFVFIAADLSSTRVVYGLLGILAAISLDGSLFLYFISRKKWFRRITKLHHYIHIKKDKNKQKTTFLKIFSQVLVSVLAILILSL